MKSKNLNIGDCNFFKMEKILVTGSCGFIGMHLCLSLLKKGYDLFGIDSMNNYYDVELKKSKTQDTKGL